jgi:hypothetical protein
MALRPNFSIGLPLTLFFFVLTLFFLSRFPILVTVIDQRLYYFADDVCYFAIVSKNRCRIAAT